MNFYDGATLLGTATLNGGSASYTISTLAAGTTSSFTATYLGDADFTGSTSSSAVTIPVGGLDFSIKASGGGSETVFPGATVSYGIEVTPTYGRYPDIVTFKASNVPAGATVKFLPASIAADAGVQTVAMVVRTSGDMAKSQNPLEQRGAPLALGFLLLPFLGLRRIRKSLLRRGMILLLITAAGTAGLVSLSGCGSDSFGSARDYAITVTATSGSVQHSFDVNLRLIAN